MSAGELSSLCGKSRSSISTYLAEICAIAPDLVEKQGMRRLLRNPGHETEELLDVFWPYLSSPITRRIRLARRPSMDALCEVGVLLSGESALSFVSDLALDDSCLTIAVTRTSLPKLQEACDTGWIEAAWYEPCLPEVEVWSYPIDRPSTINFLQQSFQVLICSTCMSHARRHHQATSDIKTP